MKKDIANFNSLPSGRLSSSLILNYISLSLREEKMTSHSHIPSQKKKKVTKQHKMVSAINICCSKDVKTQPSVTGLFKGLMSTTLWGQHPITQVTDSYCILVSGKLSK